MRGWWIGLALTIATPAAAQVAYPKVLPLRERVVVIDGIVRERLETVAPAVMRERGVDLWVLVSRENFEEPALEAMLDARSFAARRRTILVLYDPGGGRPLERLTVSRYGLAGLFAPAWTPETQPDQWRRLAEIIAERNPKRIAINVSPASAYADGMTVSAYEEMMAALPAAMKARVVRDEQLAIRWLETRSATEQRLYPEIVRLSHAILREALSDAVVKPGVTTTADVQWWLRDKVAALGLETWFHPSIAVSRRGVDRTLDGDTVIQPGDLIWSDFGIDYLGLTTDMQQNAYVLRPGETAAPQGLRDGLAANNRVQDALTSEFRQGDSGNAVLARARAKALAAGLEPSIYTHPIGTHGHGAGPAIGFWDNQNADPRGTGPLHPDTAWSIELSATVAVPEWGGQRVAFRSEENAFFDGTGVRYLDGRQTELFLIGGR